MDIWTLGEDITLGVDMGRYGHLREDIGRTFGEDITLGVDIGS